MCASVVRSIAVQAPASRALRPLPRIVTQVRVYILTSELTCSCLATRPPALPPPSLSSRPLTENEGNEDAEAFVSYCAAEETTMPEETSIPCASGGSAVRARARDRERADGSCDVRAGVGDANVLPQTGMGIALRACLAAAWPPEADARETIGVVSLV